MALASLTVDLSLGLAKFESDSGKAAQIVTRDQEKMSRAALTFQRALERQGQAAGKTATDLQTIKAATLGLGDDTLALIQRVNNTGGAFASVGVAGTAAFAAIGGAAATAGRQTDTLISQVVAKIREVNEQAKALKAQAVSQNESKSLTDDGLKVKLQSINAVREATLKQINVEFEQDRESQRAAAAEVEATNRRIAAFEKLRDTVARLNFRQTREATQSETTGSAKSAGAAIAGNATATASAQAQVYAGFLLAQAAAAEKVAQAEARQAEISKQVGAAVDRARAAQEAAYAAKVAYIGKVNEEAAALFRTRDAQRQLDAERAGVSSKEAAQLAKVAGDRELLAGIYQKIEAEENLAAAFGKSTAEILRQQAAERGISSTAAKPIARFAALEESNKAAVATATATRENNAFIESVNRQANAISKLPSQLLAEEAALRGVSAQTAVAVQRLSDFEKKTGQAGKGAFATANQLATLRYTISDVIASAGSGISPLTILLQQGPQLAQVEGGISGIFKTIISFATPARLAIAGVGAAIAAVGYAAFAGNRESKAFADSLVLTGNYAGITEGRFNALAKGIAASGQITVGAARDFAQALIGTGEVGPRVLGAATEAAARYGDATGKNAAEVAKDFAGMGQDVARWAVEHNKQLNFITAAQYDQIKSLQDQGRAADAQGIVYDALNQRFQKLDANLGFLDRALKATKTGWSSFWDAAFDVGRAETIDDKVDRAAKSLENVRARAEKGRASLPAFSSAPALREDKSADAERQANLESIKTAEFVGAARRKLREEDNAFAEGERADTTKRAIAGKELVKSYQESGKSASAYKKALDELTRSFRENADAGTPFSENAKAEALAGLKKKFEDKGANSDAASARKALLDQDIKFVRDNFAQQQEAVQFGQQALQAVYATGNVSLKQFYDAKRAIIAAGVDAELNALIDEQARLEVELDQGGFKNDADKIRVQTQLNESLDKSAKVTRDASRAVVLANIEEGTSFKALTDRVEEFRANLLQLQGDELGAARARAALQAQASRQIAVQSGGAISEEDLQRQSRAIALANDFAEVQRRAGQASAELARSEESFLLRSAQNGATLREQEQGVYAIRATSLVQLGELAEKARQFAAVSTDPRVLQYAEELALAYQKAADTVDPAINRLRNATEGLSQSLSTDIVGVFTSSKQTSSNRYAEARKEVSDQRKLYDEQLKDLRTSLARSSDAKEQALLRDLIVKTEAKKKSAEVDNVDVFFKSLERDVFGPILKKIQEAALKLLITDPLEKNLTAALREITEGDGGFASLLKDVLGASKGVKVDKSGAGIDAGGAGFSQAKDSASAYEEAASSVVSLTTTQTTLASATATQTQAVTASASAFAEVVIAARAAAAGLESVASSSGFKFSTSSSSGGGGFGTGADYGNQDYGAYLATGTNRIPYDGFKAVLHKDEAVVPAAFNPYAPTAMQQRPTKQESTGGRGWGGGAMNVIVNAPPGTQVDRQEQRDTPDGQTMEVFLSLAEKRIASGIANGKGPTAEAMKARGVNLSGAIPRRA